jgi:uncharacterized BrkB/YihY/UPF0761 family membrane protein
MINTILTFVRSFLDSIYVKNKYIPADKQRHFISGAVISVLLFLFIGFYSILVISLMAFAKEINDYFHKDVHTPDIFDWAATTSGGIVGAYIINWLII